MKKRNKRKHTIIDSVVVSVAMANNCSLIEVVEITDVIVRILKDGVDHVLSGDTTVIEKNIKCSIGICCDATLTKLD